MDYREYRFPRGEFILTIVTGAGIIAAVTWLFYKNIVAMILGMLILPVWVKRKRQEKIEKRKTRLRFDLIYLVLGVGFEYSMENAWREAEKEMRRLLGEDALIASELARINSQIALNIPVEKLLADFALRSGIEDVQSFTQVFQFAKRGGGNLTKIIQTTSIHIADKVEVEREIETAMAAKKMEQKIMSVMPLFILGYIGFSSPGFLETLYGNILGVLVMTVCLAGYLLSLKLAAKIVNIRV